MPTTITYGGHQVCQIEEAEAANYRAGSSEVLRAADIAQAVQAQLSDPIDFPPLRQCTIPGDTIVIAVDAGVPQTACVIDGVLRAFDDAGTDPTQITVLIANDTADAHPLESQIRALGHTSCAFAVHDATNEKEIAFLGVSRSDLALRLNRLLCDADFVLPVGVSLGASTQSLVELLCLYPTFSDQDTIRRLASASAESFPQLHADTAAETEDCYRQLGTQLALRVIPAANGQVAATVAGDLRSACRKANADHNAIWESRMPEPAQLAIATVTGEACQTWQNFGRALAHAQSIVEPGGPIVVCMELADPPGEAMAALRAFEDHEVVEREILRTSSEDCGPATVLCRVLEQHPVYLRSRLTPAVVESLGMTPVETDQQVERLMQSYQPCSVLEDAHWLQPTTTSVEEECDE